MKADTFLRGLIYLLSGCIGLTLGAVCYLARNPRPRPSTPAVPCFESAGPIEAKPICHPDAHLEITGYRLDSGTEYLVAVCTCHAKTTTDVDSEDAPPPPAPSKGTGAGTVRL